MTAAFRPGGLWRSTYVATVFLLALGFPVLRTIEPSAAPTVTLQAQVLLASNQAGVAPDPRLASLVAQLRKALPYSTFQLLSGPSGQAGLGQTWRTDLPGAETPGRRVLEVTPTAIDGGTIQLQARIVQAKLVQGKSISELLLNTTLRLQSGGTVVLGGPAHQNGVLVIVISASI